MKNFSIIFLLYLCFNTEKINNNQCIEEFKKYATECQPVYLVEVTGVDTSYTSVALIPVPEKQLNSCLLKIKKGTKDFEVVKEYAFLVVMKVALERFKVSPTAYWVQNAHKEYPNAIEMICLKETGWKQFDINRDTYDVGLNGYYSYLQSKPDNYFKLQELKDEMKKINDYLSRFEGKDR